MRRWLCLLSMAVVGASAGAAELSVSDFAYAVTLDADGTRPLYELTVPEALYERTVSPTLADIRFINSHGEVLPYSVRRKPESKPGAVRRTLLPMYPLRGAADEGVRALNLQVQGDMARIDLRALPQADVAQQVIGYLLDLRNVSEPISGLEVEWGADAAEFSEQLRLEVSDDLLQWRAVATGSFVNLQYNGQRLRQASMEFASVRSRFARLLWPVGRPVVTPSAIIVWQAPQQQTVEREERVRMTAPSNRREYLFDLGAQLPVDRIQLRLPERNTVIWATVMSRRQLSDPWHSVVAARFYRLANGDQPEIANPWAAIAENRDRYWLVQVDGEGGGIGAGELGLAVRWIPDRLLFVARGPGPYQLLFGSARVGAADTPLLLEPPGDSSAIASTPVTPGPIVLTGGTERLLPPPPPSPWKKWLLWGVLGGGVLVLAVIAWRLSRELGSTGTNA